MSNLDMGILTLFVLVLALSSIIVIGSWYSSTNVIGPVTLIQNNSNTFNLDGDSGISCSNFNATSLHIGEVLHVVQPHVWPFDSACQITVISD